MNAKFVLFLFLFVCVPQFLCAEDFLPVQTDTAHTDTSIGSIGLEQISALGYAKKTFSVCSIFPGISWNLSQYTGFRSIIQSNDNLIQSTTFKNVSLKADVSNLFQVQSFLTVGFLQNKSPHKVSIFNLPDLQNSWEYFEARILLVKKFSLPYNLEIFPYGGYDFSQQHSQVNFSLSEARTQIATTQNSALVIGTELTWKPVRAITMSYNIFIAPLSMSYNQNTSEKSQTFFTGNKLAATVTVKKVAATIFFSTKISLYNFSDEKNKFSVTAGDIGFNIRFVI